MLQANGFLFEEWRIVQQSTQSGHCGGAIAWWQEEKSVPLAQTSGGLQAIRQGLAPFKRVQGRHFAGNIIDQRIDDQAVFFVGGSLFWKTGPRRNKDCPLEHF